MIQEVNKRKTIKAIRDGIIKSLVDKLDGSGKWQKRAINFLNSPPVKAAITRNISKYF